MLCVAAIAIVVAPGAGYADTTVCVGGTDVGAVAVVDAVVVADAVAVGVAVAGDGVDAVAVVGFVAGFGGAVARAAPRLTLAALGTPTVRSTTTALAAAAAAVVAADASPGMAAAAVPGTTAERTAERILLAPPQTWTSRLRAP